MYIGNVLDQLNTDCSLGIIYYAGIYKFNTCFDISIFHIHLECEYNMWLGLNEYVNLLILLKALPACFIVPVVAMACTNDVS